MKRQERKNDRTINIYKILTIVLAVVLIVVLIIFGRSWMVQKNAQKEYEKLSAQVNDLQNQVNDNQINIPSDTQTETENVAQEVQTEDSELEQKGIEIPQKNLNWKKLKGVNQDIYAWIYIPGTGVDYPVLQHPSDDSYYLNYNMNGTRDILDVFIQRRQTVKSLRILIPSCMGTICAMTQCLLLSTTMKTRHFLTIFRIYMCIQRKRCSCMRFLRHIRRTMHIFCIPMTFQRKRDV